jgi:hypothetical protein
MANGGRIPPDGRPAQAPGIGKNSKRHDLEKPRARLHGTDLQQGDIQAIEQGQRIVRKATQPPARAASPPARRQGVQRASGDFQMEVPDPIGLAGQRFGGQLAQGSDNEVTIDPTPWVPMLEELASIPGASGGLTAMLTEKLTEYRRRPTVSRAALINLNAIDDILED